MKVGILFPDFGSQHVGMGKELYDSSRLMQEYFEEASNCLNTNFVKLCFASSDVELARIDHAYASLFLMSSAIGSIVAEQGIKPVAIAGFGLGEFTALHFAGSLSLPDGLYFLTKYAQLYEQVKETGSQQSIFVHGCDIRSLRKYCKEESCAGQVATITAYITNFSAFVSGHIDAIERVKQRIREHTIFVSKLSSNGGMHSLYMQSVADALDTYLEKIDIKDARVPIITCVDGMVRLTGDSLSAALLEQVTAPVRWDKIMVHVAAWDVILEIGPGSTLTKLIKAVWPTKHIYTINKQADIDDVRLLVAAQKPDER